MKEDYEALQSWYGKCRYNNYSSKRCRIEYAAYGLKNPQNNGNTIKYSRKFALICERGHRAIYSTYALNHLGAIVVESNNQ
jgi:hypothetical protein